MEGYTSSKPTPGPWTIKPFTDMDKDIRIIEPGVIVDNDDFDHDVAAANARLIAAAPELYEALRRCQRVLADLVGGDTETSTQHLYAHAVEAEVAARAALSKVEGK